MSKTLIQLFAKPPVSGQVKTRLIPHIGATAATAIFRHCLETSLELIKNSSFDAQIWLSEPSDHSLFAGMPVRLQQGQNLGERMYHAMSSGFHSGYSKVILIGSDCLDLTQQLLQRVFNKLQQHDVVFIPAVDGGYVLIAAKEAISSEVFSNIQWGSDKVLVQSLERAMQCGIDTVILNPLRDIDRVEDLKHYAALKPFLSSE